MLLQLRQTCQLCVIGALELKAATLSSPIYPKSPADLSWALLRARTRSQAHAGGCGGMGQGTRAWEEPAAASWLRSQCIAHVAPAHRHPPAPCTALTCSRRHKVAVALFARTQAPAGRRVQCLSMSVHTANTCAGRRRAGLLSPAGTPASVETPLAGIAYYPGAGMLWGPRWREAGPNRAGAYSCAEGGRRRPGSQRTESLARSIHGCYAISRRPLGLWWSPLTAVTGDEGARRGLSSIL